jgi:uncharacterized protein (DUF362 family)
MLNEHKQHTNSSLVSFVRVTKSDRCILKEAISNSLSLIDYEFSIKTKHVVIKPNMCYYWDYSTGQTTNPSFVSAIIEIVREKISPEVKISIVESDASAMKCKIAFPFLGYEKMSKNYNVELVNLSQDEGKKIGVSAGEEHFSFLLPQTIEKADLKINVPKIKYMPQSKITCALKNIFGCNPDPQKHKYHSKLDETIVALNKIMGFDLCILDGIIATGSHTRKLNLVMASQDPVAFDSAAAKIASVNPVMVEYLALAQKEGLGNIAFVPRGDDPELFAEKYPKNIEKDASERITSFAFKSAVRAYKRTRGLLKI